jgi:hypothetical protein
MSITKSILQLIFVCASISLGWFMYRLEAPIFVTASTGAAFAAFWSATVMTKEGK